MEFGVMILGYVPEFRRVGNPAAEHQALMAEIDACIAADRAGFKYMWATEHHFLDEYSHMSANDVVLGYLAHATERIHIGAGIFNPLPQVNHPVRVAERVAMLDHLAEGRFEFGTGRGAGSHEILPFLPGVENLDETREIWQDVIREFPKMWLQDEYEGYRGKYWQMPPRKILPKPYKPSHPAMWYAAGSPPSFEMAARMGLGVLGFSIGEPELAEQAVKLYKDTIVNAEPIGDYVNDNVMVCTTAFVSESYRQAVSNAVAARPMYVTSNVFRYHDTIPHVEGIPFWPELMPDLTAEMVEFASDAGAMICGDPDTAMRTVKEFEAAGVDQLVLGIGCDTPENTLETIRLFGEHIIPKFDTDPVHRTTRFRDAAR
ncbi:LLM class flavin-dependent oxidoreductase [Yinghuangia soli]|uniref:LLM class flavin-dependent oxidoreductase n=1 Tax=Yinghuangia soli TaxID=2908204 RepID=A0AA41Q364_9ACTN|nr:LLM class flavin-dependent oxidoreductase [Yinghuangia soli]MCF2530695.1 LLM class flavin-dependent oxidoreductase [Yinghuangia soli]